MELKKVALSKLRLNNGQIEGLGTNPRFIKDEKFEKLVKSLREDPEMMELREIIAYDNDGELIVIMGNMRLRAARELKHKEAQVKILPKDTPLEKLKAYTIKDNVSYGSDDWDILSADYEVDQLEDWGMDIPDIAKESEEPEAEDDNYKIPAEVTTNIAPGDIIDIGHHRLMCGDSTNPDHIDLLMGQVKPDTIHADPPYGMQAVSTSGKLSKTYEKDIAGDQDNETAKAAFQLIHSLYPEAKQIWWGANYYSSVLPDSKCWLVWDKNNGESDQTDCELAWANFESVVRLFKKRSYKVNRLHPTQKPVPLVGWIIKRFKITSNIIADYFGGSGVTMIAAHQTNKTAYLMEIEPKFCQIIVDRMHKLAPELEIKLNGEVIDL